MASTLTEAELAVALEDHPDLVERLRLGDPLALSDLLDHTRALYLDQAAIDAVWVKHETLLAKRGIHRPDLDDPMRHPKVLEDNYRFVTAAMKNPAFQRILATRPAGSGRPISRAEFAKKYLKDLPA